nr:immunoglobulin heavy chain junction region [Mus musculus]MBK4196259.1 immunoglobulin heavy chain junction region [Mus musculus]
CARGRDWADYW